MKPINITLNNKSIKSLSQRSFLKSARKRQTLVDKYKTNQTLYTEPIQKIQTPKHLKLNEAKSSKILTFNPQRKEVSPFFKSLQEYKQQNHRLKLQLNHLNETLYKQKSKHNQTTKIFAKFNKQMQIQYEDEKYYEHASNHKNLIEGVKHQYTLIKKKYQQKCLEYNELLKKSEVSYGEEYKIYAESLQVENKKLKDQLKGLISRQQGYFNQFQRNQQLMIYQNGKSLKITKQWKDKQKAKIIELLDISSQMHMLYMKQQKNQDEIKSLKQIISQLKQNKSDLNVKIKYLDNIILQKSNKMRQLAVNERKKIQQCKNMSFALQNLNKKIEMQEQNHMKQVQIILQQEKVKFLTQKNIFMKCIAQKDEHIEKLTRQIQYLSTIITYIRNEDDNLQKIQLNISKDQSLSAQGFLLNLQKSLVSAQGADNLYINNRKRVKTLIQSGLKQLSKSKTYGKTEMLKQIIISSEKQLGDSQNMNLLLQQQESSFRQSSSSRAIKRSYFKHSQNCTKVRPIKLSQIQHLKKQIIFRLINHKILFNNIKQYFDFKLQKHETLTKRQKRWKMEYTTMSQLMFILMNYPFQLKQDQAALLSRYTVEDHTNQQIYCSKDNQIQREIAKSIIRAFIGEYILPNEVQVKQELKKILQKSGKNIRSALSSLAPSGYISDVSFITICQSIQVDFSEQTKNYILSRLYAQSKSLEQLEYQYFFTEFSDKSTIIQSQIF